MWMLLTAKHWSSSCTVLSYLLGLSLLLAYGERFSFQGEKASINSLQLILIVNFSMSYAAQKWARKLEKENRKEMDDEGMKNVGRTKVKGRVEEEKVLGVREFNATVELGQDTKRETARNRGFDQRVSNISNIQDKISSLLGMIKKDKVDESVENQLERTYNPIHLHRNEAMINFSKDDTSLREKYHYHQPKQNLSYVDLKPKKYDLSNRYVNLQPKPAPRNYNMPAPRNYNQPIQRKPKEQPVKEVKKEKLKRRYLPQEDTLREVYRREKSAANTSRYPIQESYQQVPKYDIKIQRKNQCKTPKARTRYPQEKPSFLLHQNPKPSPAIDIQSKFQKIIVDSPIDRVSKQSIHQIYQIQQQDSFVLQSHIPKPQYSQFMPITELPTIAPKLNTTTQLIDQQLRRMRSKIEESESLTNRLQNPSQNP